MMQTFRFDNSRKTQCQAIITRSADLHEALSLVGNTDHVLFRHRDRPAGDMADDVGTDFLHHVEAGHLADTRARHATGMNLYFYAARVRPLDVTISFAVWQQAVVVKNKLDQFDAERLNLV